MQILKNEVKKKLGEKNYKHSLNVLEAGLILSKNFNVSEEKVAVAALLHDYAKELTLKEAKTLILEREFPMDDKSIIDMNIVHGEIASFIAKMDFGIEDKDILNAIKYHTTGREKMSVLEKIVYLADVIEPSREFYGVNNIRQMSIIDLDQAVLMAMDSSLSYLIKIKSLIHLDTIYARNYILSEMKKNKDDLRSP